MRKLIVSMMVSIDGYIEDQNKSLEWLETNRDKPVTGLSRFDYLARAVTSLQSHATITFLSSMYVLYSFDSSKSPSKAIIRT